MLAKGESLITSEGSVPQAAGRSQCRDGSRQYADNELQNRFPGLFLHNGSGLWLMV